MKRKLAALLGAVALCVTTGAPAVTGTARAPTAAPEVVAAAPSSPVDETKVPHYFGPYNNWAQSPETLPDATVTISAASLPVSPVTVGNPLVARQYATDNTVGGAGSNTPGQGTVLVIVSGGLPDGTLTSFQTYTQNDATFGSPGNIFNAYVLHPTGNVDEYSVVFDSGPLTVPGEADGIHTWSVAADMPAKIGSSTVALGDVIAFYGQGIPLDVNTGTDQVFYIAASAPPAGPTAFTVNSTEFPNLGSNRTYSFSATVTPPGPPATGSGAEASATVGANGAVTGLTITKPGSGYAAADVVITGSGTNATASADVQTSGAVTSVLVDNPGTGYTTPTVQFSGGTAGTDATGHALGGVDAVNLSGTGAGYTFPNVDFDLPDDPNGVQAQGAPVCADPYPDCTGAPDMGLLEVIGVNVTNAGSGYATAPAVVIRDGTLFDPINPPANFVEATGTATLKILSVVVDTFGDGYTSAPDVTFGGGGANAHAIASTDFGAVIALHLLTPGSGYVTSGGMKKFVDTLPGLTEAGANNLGQYIPVAVPDTTTFPGTDYYVIAVVQHRERMSSSLPVEGTLLREYVQLSTNVTGASVTPVQNTTDQFTVSVGSAKSGTFTLAVDGAQSVGPFAWNVSDADIQAALPGTTVSGGTGPWTVTFATAPTSFAIDGAALFQGKHVALNTALFAGGTTPTLMPDGSPAYGVDDPHFLGPTIVASKDRAVRIVFYNLLPKDVAGDLFLPTDTTLMGSGLGPTGMPDPVDQGTVTDEVRNPACTDYGSDPDCFTQNRATLHLHGGVTPWISDGTPHQWITPANESTPWPQGVSVQNVPDMVGASKPANVPDCTANDDGCQTFYYTNQQSARLMFYHDHAWGITRLNVYAGEAAGYVLTDPTEQKLFGPSGTYADMGEGIPLVIQDRTFVPSAAQLAGQDPTWDSSKWGGMGNLWYHHVYMPAQNPGDPGGMSAYGRWMYGPWFWPPATPQHGPIANPYYNMDPEGPDGIYGVPGSPEAADNFTTPLLVPCSLDDSSTWQYQVDPFCEPAQIPGTPNISVGMEQFNDTPIVNGTAYPTKTLKPQSYRFRILNAANDRFWNLQWYIADASTASTDLNGLGQVIGGTEVALKADEVLAAQTDPNVVPTPDLALSPAGPDWVQFASEGGFLPAPTVVDGQQVTTWITDPTRFDVGNVDKHSLLLAPAERADVIVDFSLFKGKTLILYNDAPAAFPARVPSYDYFTGGPDGLTLPGYGPNTRTIMQIKIEDITPAAAFNVNSFKNLFTHKANGSGVFEASQDPIIVGQAGYNSAYGKSFVASGDCTNPNGTNKCDGMARINQQGGDLFRFDTLKGPQVKVKLEPKALHDEMNSAAFDEFGRMTANLGLEAVPATPAGQNVMLYPYIAPPTEVIDGTNLPKGDINIAPISSGTDGTQIWKITHNGVDTHPIHFHLFNVQVLNRVTWDNIIIPTEASELGWKETVRISPLEDTIVALRPIIPTLPFEVPNAIRYLSPMMPPNADLDPNGLIVDPAGNVTTVTNALVNFGWEYVYHCHILSHEEMDMMRPVLTAVPPRTADTLAYSVTGNGNNTSLTLTWKDNSIAETSYLVQRQATLAGAWTTIGTIAPPLATPNTAGSTLSFVDTTFRWNSTLYSYRVVARNTVGYGGAYPVTNADAVSATIFAIQAPSNLVPTLQAGVAGPQVSLTFTDNALNETGFVVQRSTDGVNFTPLATLPARNNTGAVTYLDTTVTYATTYTYRVAAVAGTAGLSAFAVSAAIAVPAQPAVPLTFTAANVVVSGGQRTVALAWTVDPPNVTGYTIQRSQSPTFANGVSTTNVADPATLTLNVTGLARNTSYYFRIRANNGPVVSSDWLAATPSPITTLP